MSVEAGPRAFMPTKEGPPSQHWGSSPNQLVGGWAPSGPEHVHDIRQRVLGVIAGLEPPWTVEEVQDVLGALGLTPGREFWPQLWEEGV